MKLSKMMVAVVGLFLAGALAGDALATTYTNYVGGTSGLPVTGKGAAYKLSGMISMADVAYTTSDIVKVIAIPENCYCLAVQLDVITATPNDITVGVGDADSATTWLSSISTTNAVKNMSVAGAETAYPNGGDIRVTFSGTAGATGLLRVTAVVVDLE